MATATAASATTTTTTTAMPVPTGTGPPLEHTPGGHPMSVPLLPPTITDSSFRNPALNLPGDYNAAAAFLDRAAAQGWSQRIALRTAEGQQWTYAQVAAR